jgi:6-phospho-beta-glucosidase
MANIKDDGFSIDCLRTIQAIPSSYLQYYYCREAKLAHQREDEQTRAQVCMDIEEQLLEMYKDEAIVTKPALLDKRGGHKYSLAAVSLIDSLANDKRDVHVVNIKNNGTLPFMADDDIVEIAAVIGADGATPVPVTERINDHIVGLMRVVKTYEKYAVKAAITGDDDYAIKGLLVHPLVGDWEKTVACFNELKEAHKEFLPQYFKN